MRLRFRGSGAFSFFFKAANARIGVKENPQRTDADDRGENERRNVFTHQSAFRLTSMCGPNIHAAIATPAFETAQGNVRVPATKRSSGENVNHSSTISRQ